MLTSRSGPFLLAIVSAALVVAGCSSGRAATPVPRPPATTAVTMAPRADLAVALDQAAPSGGRPQALAPFADCADLLAWTKDRLLERVTPYGLVDAGGYIDQAGGGIIPPGPPTTYGAAAPGTPGPVANRAPGAAGETSTTNTQEIGVDEGDIAETDGRTVYSLIDNHLRSADLDTKRLLADQEVPPGDQQMVLDAGTLLVVTQEQSSGTPDTIISRYRLAAGVPSLTSRTYFEGTVLAVRSIDHTARVVLTQSLVQRIPFVRPRTDRDTDQDAALAENKRVIDELTTDDVLPRAYEAGVDGTSGPLHPAIDCTRIGHPQDFSGFGVVWVEAVALGAPDRPPTGAAGGGG